jgi:hypothetical protein
MRIDVVTVRTNCLGNDWREIRCHALHGYLRVVCNTERIAHTKEATINVLFNLIQEKHPDFAKSVQEEHREAVVYTN